MIKEDDVFKNPFIKEYLFNLQVNQQISISEFLFTKKSFYLCCIGSTLLYLNSDNQNYMKYISIAFFLSFIYLFRSSRILKKEKYFVKKDNDGTNSQQLVLHMFLSKTIKKAMKKNFIFVLLILSFPQLGYSTFENNISTSTDTQERNIELYKSENTEMVERAKLKMINYIAQEKKINQLIQIKEQTLMETDLEANKVNILIEKVKNEIKK